MFLARRRFGGAFATASLVAPTSSSVAPITTISTSSSLLTAISSSSSIISTSTSVVVSQHLQQQRRFNASDAASATTDASGGTALDVAMKVNKLKRMHQSGQGQGKKEIERLAWKELNTLSEQQIATAEGKAVALLLNSWAYFARYWEKGKDGPFDATEAPK